MGYTKAQYKRTNMAKHLHYLFMILLLLTTLSAKANYRFFVIDGVSYTVNTEKRTARVGASDAYRKRTEITIPSSIKDNWGHTYPVTSLGDCCFRNCPHLTSITIPNSVTKIGEYCFQDCTSLTSITIPNSVIELGKECFNGCTSLIRINIGNSVTKLSNLCFVYCTSLETITIPNTVRELGMGCFESCKSLKSIIIGNSVIKLGRFCFYGCMSLREVTCLASYPPTTIMNSSFDNESEMTLYVPDSTLEYYKNNEDYEWSKFGKILPLSTSCIKAISKDDVRVRSDNGTITLNNIPSTVPVSVYSTSGQLLGSGRGNISVSAQGTTMVIVKVGGKSYKVLVK